MLKETKPLSISDKNVPTISTLLHNDAKRMIKDLFIELSGGQHVKLPLEPLKVISIEELKTIQSMKQFIFFSYFSEHLKDIITRAIDFIPSTPFEYCLFGLYALEGGNVSEILKENPHLYIFTIDTVFNALFRPYKKPIDYGAIEFIFEDVYVIVKDKQYHCLELIDLLQDSHRVYEITRYMSREYELFMEEKCQNK